MTQDLVYGASLVDTTGDAQILRQRRPQDTGMGIWSEENDAVMWDLDDIAGVAEVAAALGVSDKRVQRWIERRATTRCPEPLKPLRAAKLYSVRQWRDWYRLWTLTRGASA